MDLEEKTREELILEVIALSRKLAETEERESELRRREELFRSLIENIPDPIVRYGSDCKLLYANPAFTGLCGMTESHRKTGEGMPLFERHQAILSRVFAAGEEETVEQRFSTACGEIDYQFRFAPEYSESGEVEGVAAVGRDITPLKWAEGSLRSAYEELEMRVQQRSAELESAYREVKKLPSRLIAAQEEERKRIGGELHDSIGQILAALKYRIETMQLLCASDCSPETHRMFDELVTTLQFSIEETRNIYMGLKPTILYELGLIAALQWYRRDFVKLYPGFHVEIETDIQEKDIPEALKIVIFRVTQEALGNVAKHSGAEWVDIVLRKAGDRIQLTITDDGQGFDPETTLSRPYRRSLGLTGMKERTEIMGGTFLVESCPGEGAEISASWPAKGQMAMPFAKR